MTDQQNCEHCATVFTRRREHARFCSSECRVEWHRARTGDPVVAVSALRWSVAAVGEVVRRVAGMNEPGRAAEAFAAIAEAVWSITIVDAALVRYHPDAYDTVMAGESTAGRKQLEETFAGLRFVRNRIGEDDDLDRFVELVIADRGEQAGNGPGWTWRAVTEPALDSLAPRAREWELTRYRGYQAQLAGRSVEEVFGRAAMFIEVTAAEAWSVASSPAVAAR